MMKKFLLVVCGSFVGAFLALIFCIIASMIMSFGIMGASAIGGSKSTSSIDKNSVLYIDLNGSIEERQGGGTPQVMAMLQGENITSSSLNVLISAINEAKKNKKIEGILIDCNGASASPATFEALRRALSEFKHSGKWIWAYGYEGINQFDYYLASVADSIFINPVGAVDIHGVGGVIPFYKGALDKLGIEMQVLRVGTFKSAVEPYMLDSISPANRLQMEHYLGTIWNEVVDSIATSRKMTPQYVNQLADSLLIALKADTLIQLKVVDGLCYRYDFEKKLKQKCHIDEKDDLRLVYPEDIAKDLEAKPSGDQIAVVYATGEIDGSTGGIFGGEEGIDSEKLAEVIHDLKEKDKVKGLVLRVNSPGGSAFGSEQIWKAIEDFKESGKPVAVSMGDYAASGGYYISCGADRIFAERTTITGSIGIFGIIPSGERLYKEHMHVNFSEVKTNANSTMAASGLFGIPVRKLTPTQTASLQRMINEGYELFTKRCADGRHVSQDSIKKIAEGRVWDGVTAKQIGLVDEFGGLNKAIEWVANKANLKKDKYKTQNYPDLKDDWRALFNGMMMSVTQKRMRNDLGDLYDYYNELKAIVERQHILCLMQPVELQ
ncbi:MAG: signal peptide peptidase SppA [Muribaculaceae bacterium]|nr:signal peptide peptidase SppA [Muribaculaceae bacterium]